MTPSCSYPSRQPSSVITFPVCRLVLLHRRLDDLKSALFQQLKDWFSCCWVSSLNWIKYKVLHFVWVMVSLFFLQPLLTILVLFLIPILPLLNRSLLFLELVSITFEIFDAFALFSISLLLSLLAHVLVTPGLITVIRYIMVFQNPIKSPPVYSKLTCSCHRCSTQVFWCQPDSEITSLAQDTRLHRIQSHLGHI